MWKNSQSLVKKFTITDNHYHLHCEKFHNRSTKFRLTYNYASVKFAQHFVKFEQSHTNTKLVSVFIAKKFSICVTFCEKIHKLLWKISQKLQMIIIITNCEKIHKLWKFFICENFTKTVKKFTKIVRNFTRIDFHYYLHLWRISQRLWKNSQAPLWKISQIIWIYAPMNNCSVVKNFTKSYEHMFIWTIIHMWKNSQSLWKISQL